MKVLHISTTQDGGAAWCAKRIHKAIEQKGADSRMLFAYCGENMPSDVKGDIVKPDSWLGLSYKIFKLLRIVLSYIPGYTNSFSLQRKMDALNNTLSKKIYIHHPLSEYHHLAQHPLIEWADVVHLHWVCGFVDYPSFFKHVNKPVVWTLHDHYPAVGVIHYQSVYYDLSEELRVFDGYCKEIKYRSLRTSHTLVPVAISEQMKALIKASDLFKNREPALIHNGIDTVRFHTVDRKKAFSFLRHSYLEQAGIGNDTRLFLFSSYNIWNSGKGLDRVIEALEKTDIPNKALIVIGSSKERPLPKARFPIVCVGLIDDSETLCSLYSAADFYIQASFEESFGQTPVESMACGTPVISTPTGISPELIHPFNGVLSDGFDSSDLADAIMKAVGRQYDSSVIRQYIIDHFDYSNIAEQYINLYNKVLTTQES